MINTNKHHWRGNLGKLRGHRQHSWQCGALAKLGFGLHKQRRMNTAGVGCGRILALDFLLSVDGMGFIGAARNQSSAIYPKEISFL
jgi:hypothetical protein